MKWNGRYYRPGYGIPVYPKRQESIKDLLAPLSEKTNKGNVWRPVLNQPVNVLKTTSTPPAGTATPTPTQTPTMTVTPTNTPTYTPSSTVTPTASGLPLGYTEAVTYMNAVISGGGTLDATMSGATFQLFEDLFTYGLWSKIDAFYPLLGGSSSGGQAVNGKTPGTFNMTWNGGITFSNNGAQGNGTNGYGNTGYIELTNGTLDSAHIGVYTNVNSLTAGNDFGTTDAVSKATFLRLRNNYPPDQIRGSIQGTGVAQYQTGSTDSSGMTLFTRNGSTLEAFRNGTTLGSVSAASTGLVGTYPYFFMTYNGAGTPNPAYSARLYQFLTFGEYLTPTEVGNYSTAVINFNTTLSRA